MILLWACYLFILTLASTSPDLFEIHDALPSPSSSSSSSEDSPASMPPPRLQRQNASANLFTRVDNSTLVNAIIAKYEKESHLIYHDILYFGPGQKKPVSVSPRTCLSLAGHGQEIHLRQNLWDCNGVQASWETFSSAVNLQRSLSHDLSCLKYPIVLRTEDGSKRNYVVLSIGGSLKGVSRLKHLSQLKQWATKQTSSHEHYVLIAQMRKSNRKDPVFAHWENQ